MELSLYALGGRRRQEASFFVYRIAVYEAALVFHLFRIGQIQRCPYPLRSGSRHSSFFRQILRWWSTLSKDLQGDQGAGFTAGTPPEHRLYHWLFSFHLQQCL